MVRDHLLYFYIPLSRSSNDLQEYREYPNKAREGQHPGMNKEFLEATRRRPLLYYSIPLLAPRMSARERGMSRACTRLD